jgi:hypothetical protein
MDRPSKTILIPRFHRTNPDCRPNSSLGVDLEVHPLAHYKQQKESRHFSDDFPDNNIFWSGSSCPTLIFSRKAAIRAEAKIRM